jgi:heavy metal translocating P-type ATPase
MMTTTTFGIGGMHCASCVARNERTLLKLPGVRKASVNLATANAHVEFDESAISEALIRQAVERSGYHVLTQDNAKDAKDAAAGELSLARSLAFTAILLSVPVVVLAMAELTSPWAFQGVDAFVWIQAVLSTVVILGLGWPFHRGMVQQTLQLSSSMDTLISVGTLAALGFSVFAMTQGHAHYYFETGAVITALILLGRYFEARSRGRASSAIEKLMQLGAKSARVLRGGRETELPVEEVVAGDILQIRPGEKIPVDGVVLDGSSVVDEAMLTGESMPALKTKGDMLFGGTINTSGALRMQASKVGADTTLAQIVRMVEAAQNNKAPVQRLADRIAGIFVPVVLCIAALTFVGWLLATGQVMDSIIPAVAVLVIACPCALGLATPTAIMVGTGLGAQRGILIKDGEALERCRNIDVMLFDKTGTLTQGRPRVQGVVTATGVSEGQLLHAAASVEALSEHPLARAIVEAAGERAVEIAQARDFASEAGKGAMAHVGAARVIVGNAMLMREHGVPIQHLREVLDRYESDAHTAVVVAQDGKALGVIGIADTIKDDAKEAIAALRSAGVHSVMVTGDNEATARAIAARLDIHEVRAQVLPGEKAQAVMHYQNAGRKVAFAGDGINDAPALAQANLGIAMGTGSDIAIEAGHIVLVKGSPMKAYEALTLSRITFSTIRQNLFWAFAYNVAAIPLAAAGMLNPMIAAAAMALSSVTVVGNSLRIRARLAALS